MRVYNRQKKTTAESKTEQTRKKASNPKKKRTSKTQEKPPTKKTKRTNKKRYEKSLAVMKCTSKSLSNFWVHIMSKAFNLIIKFFNLILHS